LKPAGSRWLTLLVLAGLPLGLPQASLASLTRNAAGPRNMGEAGALTVDTAAELTGEPDGRSWLFEAGIQYQITDRLQLLLEATPFERVDPDDGEAVGGLGDTDVTVSWLAAERSGVLPDVVVGAKVKLPTAPAGERGTGKTDASALLILARESEELELTLETEYATFGSPSGESLKNQLLYTLTVELSLSDLLAAYVEALGNSAPTDEESRTDAALLGVEIDLPVSERAAPYVSLEVDTEETWTARLGAEWTW